MSKQIHDCMIVQESILDFERSDSSIYYLGIFNDELDR